MDKRTQLTDLARRLRRASSAADRSALGALDREVAHVLRSMPARTWSSDERAAFEELRLAHGEARERCERETARIDETLVQMRLHRDGWMAYAMSDSHEMDVDEARR